MSVTVDHLKLSFITWEILPSSQTDINGNFIFLTLESLPLSAVMWLWTLGRGDMAISVTRKLCHVLSQLPIPFRCQPCHRHWYSHHGDRLLGVPGCYQGKQVPPFECKSPIQNFYMCTKPCFTLYIKKGCLEDPVKFTREWHVDSWLSQHLEFCSRGCFTNSIGRLKDAVSGILLLCSKLCHCLIYWKDIR